MLKQTLLTLGVAAMVAGCTTSNQVVKDEDPVVLSNQVSVTVFVDKNGGLYTLNSTDFYQTAKFTTADGKIYDLKVAPSANGIRMVNGDTEVFFTDEDVFMTIDGKEVGATIKK